MDDVGEMIVYHGSNSNFKKLRIDKSLVKHQSTLDNEGLGIYFSTDWSIADSYGKYVYILEINDSMFYDFRNLSVSQRYVADIRKRILGNFGVDIAGFADLDTLAYRVYSGGQAICGVGHEIYMLLDSSETWFRHRSTLIQKVYKYLRSVDKNCPKVYMFRYSIRDVGVIKDVSDDVVRILEKRRV